MCGSDYASTQTANLNKCQGSPWLVFCALELRSRRRRRRRLTPQASRPPTAFNVTRSLATYIKRRNTF